MNTEHTQSTLELLLDWSALHPILSTLFLLIIGVTIVGFAYGFGPVGLITIERR